MRALHLSFAICILLNSSAFTAITPTSLASGTEGLGFKEVVFTSDQVNPKDPSVAWKALGVPPGLGMDSKGKYLGKPTKFGNFTVSISVYTRVGGKLLLKDSTTINHTINATNPPTINGAFILPSGQYDQRYQQSTGGHRLTASGDYPYPSNSKYPNGFVWEAIKGASEFQSLPQGLTLSPNGVISGVPTGRAPIPTSNQTYTFRVKATDMVGKSSIATFTLVVNKATPPQILSECPLPDGLEQTVYKNLQLKGTGGKTAYNWTIQPISNFPAGLKLDNKTGIISGKPSSYGNYTFSIVLRDANGFSVNKSCAMSVYPIPRITTTAIFDCATVGKEVCSVIEAIGGTPPYSWEITPALSGVTISPSGSKTIICGNFTSSGNKSVTVKVTDLKTKKSTVKSFDFTVSPALQITTSNPLATGKVGDTYTDFLTATGGKAPYTWQILPQIYVADFNNFRIRKFTENGTIRTYAGKGINASSDGNLTTSSFNQPYGMGFDTKGNLYVADRSKIRKIDFAGNVTTLNGTFSNPEDMVADDSGNVYVADAGTHFIKKINSLGQVDILAGGNGYADGIGTSAKFNGLQGICWDLDGDMLVTDMNNHAIRKISINGTVTTVAGAPPPIASPGYADADIAFAKLNGPHDVKVGNDGAIYVLDHSNGCIRKISVNGIVSTLGIKNNLTNPYCLSVDRSGFVYVSDGGTNHNISKISPNGNVTVIAGPVVADQVKSGFVDNVPPLQAKFNSPRGVEINPYEDLPVGLTLNATSGKINGTPEAYGLYSLTYRVTDSCGNSAISNCTLTINTRKPEFDFELPWKFTDTGAIASGHTGSLRNYTSNTMPSGALWTVNSDNLTLKVTWENSSNCAGGNNSNTQSATATINMTTTKTQKVGLSWSGVGELEEPGFENMEVYIDGNLIGKAQAAGGNKGCAMGPVVSVNNYPNGYTLPAGNHAISINATTKDRYYHTGAYYQFSFTLVE